VCSFIVATMTYSKGLNDVRHSARFQLGKHRSFEQKEHEHALLEDVIIIFKRSANMNFIF